MTTKRKASNVFLDMCTRAAELEALFDGIEAALIDHRLEGVDRAMFLASIGKRLADSTGAIAESAFGGRYDAWTTELTSPDKKKAVAATTASI